MGGTERDDRINRNIVECKAYNGVKWLYITVTVLIETLWNVKHSIRARAQGDTDEY